MATPGTDQDRLQRLRPILELRQAVHQSIRRFFVTEGFLEVETPLRIPAPALERHIDAEPAGNAFLRTSPELHMKRLLAAGYPRVFQIGPCFRQGERGHLHHPEYSMLEWYRARAGYLDILEDTGNLLARTAEETLGQPALSFHGERIDLTPPWPRLSVSDAFRRWAGWDPTAAFDEDRFNHDLVTRVEPNLPRDRPLVLIDYPAAQAALARLKPGNPALAERWELYVAGIELANAFSELTDPAEQRARFEECRRQRAADGKPVYPLDEPFLAALEQGMPPAGGIALGIDRLVLLFADRGSLDDILPFRVPD